MPIRILKPSRGHKRGKSFRNTRRENRLEELGRVDAEKAYTSKGKKNLREEKSRIRSELAVGGTVAREIGQQLKDKRMGRGARKRKAGPKRSGPRTARRGTPGLDQLKGRSRRKAKPKVDIASPEDNRYPKGMRVLGGADEKLHKKPHSTPEGRWASIQRAGKRFKDKTYKIEDYGDKSLDIQWKAENKARKQRMASGGRTKGPNRPRPQGPHMWVRGDKRKKYASGGVVMAGKKVGCQIK